MRYLESISFFKLYSYLNEFIYLNGMFLMFTGMNYMFTKTNFNQDISLWNINPNCNIDSIFKECNNINQIFQKLIIKYIRESDNQKK